jgi:hypothetical protein
VDHHTVAAVSITGTCLDVIGSLYLAYDFLGGQHGPLRLLTRAVTYSIVFAVGYWLGLGKVREFYTALEGPVVVGIEATGTMQWFLELLEESGIVCRGGSSGEDSGSRDPETEAWSAGCPADVGPAHEGGWLSRDLDAPRASSATYEPCCRDRHQWVKIRTPVQNTLQATGGQWGMRT